MSLLTYDDVAAELNVSERTVRRLVDRGELRMIRVASLPRVRPEDLHRFVAARAVTRVRDRVRPASARAVRGPSSFRDQLRAVS